jgi:3-vinyl bacteriochlorophyllide hydratase
MYHRKVRGTISKESEGIRAQATRHQLPSVSHHSGGLLSIIHYVFCSVGFTPRSALSPSVALSPSRVRPTGGATAPIRPLYTAEERHRRDASPWTLVQGVLAPIQFVAFLISFSLVLRYLASGDGLSLATASIVIKTLLLYTIMITGSIWEREIFGQYLFARPFFWEDVFSMLVLALHTLYLLSLITGALDARQQMLVALAAYATYVVNAAQFLLKLRAARCELPGDNVVVAEPAR